MSPRSHFGEMRGLPFVLILSSLAATSLSLTLRNQEITGTLNRNEAKERTAAIERRTNRTRALDAWRHTTKPRGHDAITIRCAQCNKLRAPSNTRAPST